jgi:hypothetical protein
LARDRLLARGDDAIEVIVATPYQLDKKTASEQILRDFVHDMLPSVQSSIARATAQASVASTTTMTEQ